MSSGIVGVLLAAGQGTRFGGNKLLYPLDDGTPMSIAAARPLRAVLDPCIAVVADSATDAAQRLAQEGLQLVVNPNARDGIGSSIACAVSHSRGADGWIIALADMPWISEQVIKAVVSGLQHGADIIAPVYRTQRGHPVGFSRRHAQALLELQGDEGARSIIAAHRDRLELIEVQEEGVIVDIDSGAGEAT